MTQIYSCETCVYNTYRKRSYQDHLLSKKHQINIGLILVNYCELCQKQSTCRSNYLRHLNTIHQINTDDIKFNSYYLFKTEPKINIKLKPIINIDNHDRPEIITENVSENHTSLIIPTYILPTKTNIPKKVHSDVWEKWIGFDHIACLCPLCQMSTIKFFDTWHCAHVIPSCNGGTTNIYNLRPICSGCNQGMGTQNMIDYCATYPGALKRLSLDRLPLLTESTNRYEFNQRISIFNQCINNGYID